MVVDIPDVITSANFGEDRLRGLGVAGGQNLPFSIDFDRRPYNTLALPCECVMMKVGPLTTEIDLGVWGTPANFNGFCVLASLLHRRRSTEVNQTLHDVWPSPGLLCIFGGSCP